jgi:hypothetical protein
LHNKIKRSFEEIVNDALSEMDYNLLDKVLINTDSGSWSGQDWENYCKVAKVVVEPESFLDQESYEYSNDELEAYHDLGEDRDDPLKQYYYISNSAGEVDNRIKKLCELIFEVGY